jgi:hypothetical protein
MTVDIGDLLYSTATSLSGLSRPWYMIITKIAESALWGDGIQQLAIGYAYYPGETVWHHHSLLVSEIEANKIKNLTKNA